MSNSSFSGWLIAMSRRRMLTTTLIYAASLTIRAASTAGEGTRQFAPLTTAVPLVSSVTNADRRIDAGLSYPADCRSRCGTAIARLSRLDCGAVALRPRRANPMKDPS